MALCERLAEYKESDTTCEGFFCFDDAHLEPRPAVLIAHAWGGRDSFVEDKARRLAGAGYAAFALDLYGKGRRGRSKEACSALMSPLMNDRELLERRMRAALDTLCAESVVDAGRVAAMGYCFGGLCVLDLARSGAGLRGVASFHGLLKPPARTGRPIRGAVLAMHGHDDPMVPPEEVLAFEHEMTEAGADWQVHVYGNTLHAFTNPEADDPDFGTVYDRKADLRSWRTLMNFLEEVLS